MRGLALGELRRLRESDPGLLALLHARVTREVAAALSRRAERCRPNQGAGMPWRSAVACADTPRRGCGRPRRRVCSRRLDGCCPTRCSSRAGGIAGGGRDVAGASPGLSITRSRRSCACRWPCSGRRRRSAWCGPRVGLAVTSPRRLLAARDRVGASYWRTALLARFTRARDPARVHARNNLILVLCRSPRAWAAVAGASTRRPLSPRRGLFALGGRSASSAAAPRGRSSASALAPRQPSPRLRLARRGDQRLAPSISYRRRLSPRARRTSCSRPARRGSLRSGALGVSPGASGRVIAKSSSPPWSRASARVRRSGPA